MQVTSMVPILTQLQTTFVKYPYNFFDEGNFKGAKLDTTPNRLC